MNTEFITRPASHLLNWRGWVYGLLSGIIGGVANSVVIWLGMAGVSAAGVKDVHALNLKELGIICLTTGIFSAALYLKQSPLPAELPEMTPPYKVVPKEPNT